MIRPPARISSDPGEPSRGRVARDPALWAGGSSSLRSGQLLCKKHVTTLGTDNVGRHFGWPKSMGVKEGHFDSWHHFVLGDILMLQYWEVSNQGTRTAVASLLQAAWVWILDLPPAGCVFWDNSLPVFVPKLPHHKMEITIISLQRVIVTVKWI